MASSRRGTPPPAPKVVVPVEEELLPIHAGNHNYVVLFAQALAGSGNYGKGALTEEDAATLIDNAVLLAETFLDNLEGDAPVQQ